MKGRRKEGWEGGKGVSKAGEGKGKGRQEACRNRKRIGAPNVQ